MSVIERLSAFYQRFAARRMFARWAPDYDRDVAANAYSAAAAVARAILPRLDGLDAPSIVDAGIGTGLLSLRLVRAMNCAITGLDNSAAMLAACAATDLPVRLAPCDLGRDAWPVDSGSQDAVVSAGLLEYLTDSMAAHFLKEAGRALRPDGWAAFTYIPAAAANRATYWNGKSGGYLCCTQAPGWIESMLRAEGLEIARHDAPFAGCVFADGSRYDYRLVVARKAVTTAR